MRGEYEAAVLEDELTRLGEHRVRRHITKACVKHTLVYHLREGRANGSPSRSIPLVHRSSVGLHGIAQLVHPVLLYAISL